MSRKNKKYDDDFKATIVELYNSGKSLKDICDEYGVPISTARKWIVDKKVVFESEDIAMADFLKLKKEMKQLKEENDILKKAMTIFAKK